MKKFLISSIIFLILILTACAPAPTATIEPTYTPSPIPTSTSTLTPTAVPAPTETPLPQVMLEMGLPAEDLKNFATQDDGSVTDKRDGSVAIDAKGEIVGIKYGNWVLNENRELVAGNVLIDNLTCMNDKKSRCIESITYTYLKGDAFRVNGAISGAFERITIFGPKTQEKLGIGDTVVIKTEGGEFPLLITYATNDKPESNEKSFGGLIAKFTTSAVNPVGIYSMPSPAELTATVPQGLEVWMLFLKDHTEAMKKLDMGGYSGSGSI